MIPPVCGYTLDGSRCRKRGEHRCAGRVRHVAAFFAELLTHTKGDWARRPFVLSRWQLNDVVAPLIGIVVWDEERSRYVRRYRILYLNVARKNGKSELLAGLVLYLLCADGEASAEIYGLAMDSGQAALVFRVASRMVINSPVLRTRLQVIRGAERIVDETTNSFYAVAPGDAEGNLGEEPSGAVIDELLTQKGRDLFDAMRTSMGTRAQPLLLLATTAESDPSGFAASEREWSEQVWPSRASNLSGWWCSTGRPRTPTGRSPRRGSRRTRRWATSSHSGCSRPSAGRRSGTRPLSGASASSG